MAVRPNSSEPSARMLFPRRVWQRWNDATETWRGAMILGIATALTIWVVWYFTKAPCTPDNAAAGLCDGGWLARYINAEILVLAGGAGIAVATLKGGFDTYMLKDMLRQEREARQRAEQELEKERAARRARAEQELTERAARQAQAEQELTERAARQAQANDRDDRHDELRAEFYHFLEQYRQDVEQRRQAEEQRRQAEEQRRQAEWEERRQAEQEDRRQFMSIQQAMLDTIVQLAQQRNGGGGNSNGNGRAGGE